MTISNGLFGYGLNTQDSSMVTILGGSFDRSFDGGLVAQGQSKVSFFGGSFAHSVVTDASTVMMSGGWSSPNFPVKVAACSVA
jgi:hypothetical protein